MSADSRMMTLRQVNWWAHNALREALDADGRQVLPSILFIYRDRFIARAVSDHKIARSIMKQGGYLNDN